MSNLATADRLRSATSQLPVSWYCDPAIYALEQKHLFAPGPGYVGHELMVPEAGDYYTLDWRDKAQVLVRNGDGAGAVELLSNICRHRQAIMLDGRGNAPNIVCPINRWTYANFTVYFEKNRVIDAVANKADANEVGPKPAIR